MVRRFRELLFSIHHLPMQEQKMELQKTSNEWLGKVKQIDDMLVVGVKI